MCTNYRAPDEGPGISELKIGIGDLYCRDPWDLEVYPDYGVPIVYADRGDADVVKAVFGFWPKSIQPEKREEQGRRKKKLDTMNARPETVGTSRLGGAWRDGQRCLIPARWIHEPCYETGRSVWHRISLADWQSYCVAGIWRRYEGEDGRSLVGMAMLTVNADGHAVMGRMHKPGDEKRSIVILRPADYDEWLHTKNVEAAQSMLQLYPADSMVNEPK
ncbi:hypothetical protein WM36_02090 [Burkholderia ubonensis]|uniref:SOS response-associated peptidase family protein n=1 Tax=Burkholderia ubonensis TaxID=101571 RepID=UPI000754E308|nr:SOS response-associated peptidase family protein [Burkholderia ubonensis]KVA71122.1 hypothetical protein WM36_02090 [Burkholderia ubonensis]KVO56234.1 hypothetical protein WJ77_14045 [Burkholderia ubonensis]